MALPVNSTNAVLAFEAALASAGTLQGAAISVLNPVAFAAQAMALAVAADMAANDPSLAVSSPDGSDPAVLASWLGAVATAMAQQADLAAAKGYAGRIAVNLANGGA
jgi:hypothetical protein